jgi:hypothetical protein
MHNTRAAQLLTTSSAILIFSALAGSVLTPKVLRSQTGMAVWAVSSLVRVGPTDAPGGVSSVTLYGARGEYVDAQLVVTAPSNTPLTGVDVTPTDLVGPGGAVIDRSNYSLYREHYVTFDTGSLDFGPYAANRPLPPGTYPDPLIPFNDPETGAPLSGSGASLQAVPFDVGAGRNQPIWIDLFIPRGAAASPSGLYTGSIVVTGSHGRIEVKVSLNLWNFELPLVPSAKTLFFIFDNRRGMVKANQAALLRHKIMPMRVWDPSFAESHIADFGLNRTDLPYYGGATCHSIEPAPSAADIQSQAAQYPPGLPLDIYPADEVGGCTAIYPGLKEWARNAHAAGVKIVSTMRPDPALYDDESGSGAPVVDYWAMLPRQWPSSLAGIPGEFWSYNNLEGDHYSPKWQIDFLPINYRIQAGFLNQMVGATGLLYWAVDNWPDEGTAWDDVLVGPISGAYWPGEGILIYPGARVGTTEPAPSMRLKYLRDGIQDYEYVELLRRKDQMSFINSVIRPVATDWHNWTKDYRVLETVRLQSAKKLHRLASAQ